MQRLSLLGLLGLVGLPFALACKSPSKGGDAGTDAAPSASVSASDTPADSAPPVLSAPTPVVHGPPHASIPTAGGGCNPSTETLGCSADHQLELTCGGGLWRTMQACRGPGGCKGAGAGVTCDVGTLIAGDPCVAGNPPARCVNPRSVQQCSGGKWTESVCMPPSTCKPNGNGNQAACK